MRKTLLALLALLALLVLLSVPLVAQDRPRRLSVFISEPGLSYSEGSGSNFSGGFGAAFELHFGQKWSTEIAVTREEHRETLLMTGSNGQLVFQEVDLESQPVDLTVRYHFHTPTMRWRPYAGLGARSVKAPSTPAGNLDDRVSAQVIAGLDFNLTREWSLRIDAKQLLRTDDAPHDALLKVSIGAGFRF